MVKKDEKSLCQTTGKTTNTQTQTHTHTNTNTHTVHVDVGLKDLPNIITSQSTGPMIFGPPIAKQ